MLKLFTNPGKPTSSHQRSQTLPHVHPLSQQNANPPPLSNAQEDGFQQPQLNTIHLLIPTIPESNSSIIAPIAEPVKAHQRNLTEQSRATKDLPPLFTQSAGSGDRCTAQTSDTSISGSALYLDEFQLSPEQSRQSSPTRSNRLSAPRFTGDRSTQNKQDDKAGKLADWFRGESEPIAIRLLPSQPRENADPMNATTASSDIRPNNLPQRKSTAQSGSRPAMASRFSFFSSKATLAKTPPHAVSPEDELVEMDISKALFPCGPADPFSPAAFKNLQQNAEGLLRKLQSAYRERSTALLDMTAEKEALFEEFDGAETRARHLKMQLDDMSGKLAEQDGAMMNLVDELAQEKLARREEEEARKRSVRLVEHAASQQASHPPLSRSNTISDSGCESEDDSTADSVFSQRSGTHSPAMSMSSVSTTSSPGAYQNPEFQTALSFTRTAHPRVLRPSSKGIPAFYNENIPEEPMHPGEGNYEGARETDAWHAVSMLKDENQCLKERVGELEGALDGCLAVVGRLS